MALCVHFSALSSCSLPLPGCANFWYRLEALVLFETLYFNIPHDYVECYYFCLSIILVLHTVNSEIIARFLLMCYCFLKYKLYKAYFVLN